MQNITAYENDKKNNVCTYVCIYTYTLRSTVAPHQILACSFVLYRFVSVCVNVYACVLLCTYADLRTVNAWKQRRGIQWKTIKKEIKTHLKDQGKNYLFVGYCRQGAFSSHIVQSYLYSRCQLYYCNYT